jgi:hypothetical protein
MSTHKNPEVEAKRLKRLREKLAGVPLSEEHKRKMSEAMKRRWASGTRKRNPPESWKKMGETFKKRYAEGKIRRRPVTSEEMRAMCAMRDREKMVAANRKIAEARRGTPNPPGPSARGPGHWKSKYWRLRTPAGVVLEGRNLNHLIRENAHLFAPEDIRWEKSRCRASAGLAQLFQQRPNGPTSWKGWTAVTIYEGPHDPLERKTIEEARAA